MSRRKVSSRRIPRGCFIWVIYNLNYLGFKRIGEVTSFVYQDESLTSLFLMNQNQLQIHLIIHLLFCLYKSVSHTMITT